jgi:hypothetical protein
MPAGRPTKYKKEYDEQAYKLCLLGCTDAELSDFFEIDEATINRWKKSHPTFCESIKRGKKIADAEVGERLYQRAMGYDDPDAVYFSNFQGKVTETPYTKHYPPDPTSMIFWLKNRQRGKWRDKQSHEHSGPDGGPIDNKITIEIVKTKERK